MFSVLWSHRCPAEDIESSTHPRNVWTVSGSSVDKQDSCGPLLSVVVASSSIESLANSTVRMITGCRLVDGTVASSSCPVPSCQLH